MTPEEVERAMGILINAGWTRDDILDSTWDQIMLAASCAATDRFQTIAEVVSPFVQALGGKYKAGRVGAAPMTPEQKELATLAKFRAAGVEIEDA